MLLGLRGRGFLILVFVQRNMEVELREMKLCGC